MFNIKGYLLKPNQTSLVFPPSLRADSTALCMARATE